MQKAYKVNHVAHIILNIITVFCRIITIFMLKYKKGKKMDNHNNTCNISKCIKENAKSKCKCTRNIEYFQRFLHYNHFLGAKAPLGLAHVNSNNGTKKFQNS